MGRGGFSLHPARIGLRGHSRLAVRRLRPVRIEPCEDGLGTVRPRLGRLNRSGDRRYPRGNPIRVELRARRGRVRLRAFGRVILALGRGLDELPATLQRGAAGVVVEV